NGPQATLGPAFKVNLPRPRDRKAVNHDHEYQALRARITQYLLAMGAEKGADTNTSIVLPEVVPITAARMPGAVRDATKTKPATNVDKYVEFYDVSKIYATPNGPLTVVEHFDLDLKKGEFISLIGHSGCGKSTVLSMAARLSDLSGGGIVLDGK